MLAIIEEAKSSSVELLELYVDTKNTRALNFYLRHGFERIATYPGGVRINGKPHDAYLCLKRL